MDRFGRYESPQAIQHRTPSVPCLDFSPSAAVRPGTQQLATRMNVTGLAPPPPFLATPGALAVPWSRMVTTFRNLSARLRRQRAAAGPSTSPAPALPGTRRTAHFRRASFSTPAPTVPLHVETAAHQRATRLAAPHVVVTASDADAAAISSKFVDAPVTTEGEVQLEFMKLCRTRMQRASSAFFTFTPTSVQESTLTCE
ncbi:hypothetical protein HPB47_027794 [Ixodes persulcatus]|uniref:Uncharacterized protein n=1 Tax=Ixodes persulcatus TaxID=34615 RepID=A0AC60PW66_IXOPE|nr:hypothetical protein HPB47_027794 [Ixodes persulcatus]